MSDPNYAAYKTLRFRVYNTLTMAANIGFVPPKTFKTVSPLLVSFFIMSI